LQGLPKTFPVIHWHNDMPGETKDSVVLAYSEGCPRQILRYAPHVYGFQCHLEITPEGIEDLIAACPGDLKPARFVQTAEQLKMQAYKSVNDLMIELLDRFISLQATQERRIYHSL
jgi:GMP synthase (glutamine-hydrolysing)